MKIISSPLSWTVFIFICAAFFRLTNLDLIEFKLDEARDVYEMEKFWHEPYFIQRGTIQSTGVYNPPLWYYFLALISLPSRDPQYLTFVIALINCLAVAGFYLVVRKFYGSTRFTSGESKPTPEVVVHGSKAPRGVSWFGVAEIAGLLAAFSPWMIVMSRKIWAPDLVFPLAVAWFYFLHVVISGRTLFKVRPEQRWAWPGLVLTLMLLVQLHASGIFLAAGTVIVLVIVHLGGVLANRSATIRGVLLGLFLGLIPLLPYLGYQLTNNCPDCQAFLTYQQGEAVGAAPEFDTNAILRPFQLINASSWNGVLGEEGYRSFLEKNPLMGFLSLVFLLEFGLFVAGAVFLCSPGNSPPGSQGPPRGWLLTVLILIVSLLVFITKTPAHLYYFLIVSPISIVIYGLGIVQLGKLFHLEGVKAHLPGALVFSVIILINIIFTISFYRFLGEEREAAGEYGATYGLIKELAEEQLGEYRGRADYNLIRAEFFVNSLQP